MIDRFNGRISEVLATPRFRSGEHLAETLQRYVTVYNHHLHSRHWVIFARWKPWNSGG